MQVKIKRTDSVYQERNFRTGYMHEVPEKNIELFRVSDKANHLRIDMNQKPNTTNNNIKLLNKAEYKKSKIDLQQNFTHKRYTNANYQFTTERKNMQNKQLNKLETWNSERLEKQGLSRREKEVHVRQFNVLIQKQLGALKSENQKLDANLKSSRSNYQLSTKRILNQKCESATRQVIEKKASQPVKYEERSKQLSQLLSLSKQLQHQNEKLKKQLNSKSKQIEKLRSNEKDMVNQRMALVERLETYLSQNNNLKVKILATEKTNLKYQQIIRVKQRDIESNQQLYEKQSIKLKEIITLKQQQNTILKGQIQKLYQCCNLQHLQKNSLTSILSQIHRRNSTLLEESIRIDHQIKSKFDDDFDVDSQFSVHQFPGRQLYQIKNNENINMSMYPTISIDMQQESDYIYIKRNNLKV